MQTQQLDYIIVGQGLAGSLLSWFLLKAGKSVLVIDALNISSSSRIAAGIINPITGRKFVKTWLADELIPFAEATYAELEKQFGEKVYDRITIAHLFDSIKSQNDWSVRCATEGYKQYLTNEQLVYFDKQKIENPFGAFEISGGGRLNAGRFIALYRQYLQSKSLLLEERFEFEHLQHGAEGIMYKEYSAAKIIFCEGAAAVNNPYFKFLPFQLAKGECLVIRIPGFNEHRIIKAEIALMPLPEKELYYVGATHGWYFDDDKPGEMGKNELLGNLSAVLRSEFEIVEHKAAIRPTVKYRRPLIGFHPQFGNIGIFNGMGTKGVSLAPYFAQHFVQHLLQGLPLMPEVEIQKQ